MGRRASKGSIHGLARVRRWLSRCRGGIEQGSLIQFPVQTKTLYNVISCRCQIATGAPVYEQKSTEWLTGPGKRWVYSVGQFPQRSWQLFCHGNWKNAITIFDLCLFQPQPIIQATQFRKHTSKIILPMLHLLTTSTRALMMKRDSNKTKPRTYFTNMEIDHQ